MGETSRQSQAEPVKQQHTGISLNHVPEVVPYYADFSATTRRRERAGSDSQPESDGVPEYSVRVTSVARNGESLERGRLHDEMDSDDDHRCSLLAISMSVRLFCV